MKLLASTIDPEQHTSRKHRQPSAAREAMSAQSCQEGTNHDDSERTKQRTGSPQVDADNQGSDGLFPKVKGSGPVKRAREEYEERRHKMARKIMTEAASDGGTEDVQVQDLLPPSYKLFVDTPRGKGARLRFRAKKPQDDGEVVYVLPMITNRPLVEKVLYEFEENGKEEGMYIHGLRGIGKSYSLAYLVHHLREQPDKYRVTYVHDCKLWVQERGRAWRFILEEILFTFALDTFPRDSKVHECCAKMLRATGSEDPSRDQMIETFFYSLVGALKRWVRSKKLLWVAVFDQVNALENWRKETRKQELPATCSWVESAAQTVAPGTFVTVVSASATNENIRAYGDLRQLNVGLDLAPFSKGETKYIVEEHIKEHGKFRWTEDDIKHLIWRTGNMPWNVVSVLWTPGENLRQKVVNWAEGLGDGCGYAHAVRTAHMEYRKYLGSLKQANPEVYGKSPLDQLERCVGCAVLRVPVEAADLGCIDKRYMYIRQEAPNEEGWRIANPMFCDFCDPVARHAIEGGLREPVNVFAMVAQPLLARLDVPSVIKGAVIEGFILRRLRSDQNMSFTIHECKWVHNEEKQEVEKSGDTKKAVKIEVAALESIPIHSYVPEGDIPDGWIYYIPEKKNYKGCDLVIVNKNEECAYAIQITTNIESHKWTWWDNKNDKSQNRAEVPHTSPFDKWRRYLGFEPQLVWLCPRLPRVDSRTNKWCSSLKTTRCRPNHHYFILFKDVEMDFNVLKAYRDKDI